MSEHTNEQINQQTEPQLEELTRMVEPDAPKMGPVQRIINLFLAPGELMQNIKLYPVIAVPFVVALIIGLVSIPATSQMSELMMQELSIISIEMYGVDLSGWTQLQEQGLYGDDLTSAFNVFATVTMAISAAIMPFLYSAIAAVLFIILVKILRGGARIGQLFSMSMHLYIISALGTAVVAALMVSTGRLVDMTSLAAVIMPDGNISMLQFNLLSSISIFNIWSHVLVFIGIKVLNDFSVVKAGIITGVSLLATIAIHVGTYMSTFVMWDMIMRSM